MFATPFSIAGGTELQGSHIGGGGGGLSTHGLHAELRKIGETVQKQDSILLDIRGSSNSI
jgi:hypothetical protein